jgi:6-pyruvoyltetrahydropterin/6-carboxytetrahydropterin synthase
MNMKNLKKIRISRGEHRFASAHFLPDMGKCERLHGHNYQVDVQLAGTPGETGAIIDFNDLVPMVTEVVKPLDHHIIIATLDTRQTIKESGNEIEVRFKENRFVFPKSNCVMLPVERTTVESLSEYLAVRIGESLSESYPNIEWIELSVSEGATQSASTRITLKS